MKFSAVVDILFERAPDVPGTWVGRCGAYGIVGFGSSLREAMDDTRDAVLVAIADDMVSGLDPHDRVSDIEALERVARLRRSGQSAGAEFPNERDIAWLIAPLAVEYVELHSAASSSPVHADAPGYVPSPWMIAGFDGETAPNSHPC